MKKIIVALVALTTILMVATMVRNSDAGIINLAPTKAWVINQFSDHTIYVDPTASATTGHIYPTIAQAVTYIRSKNPSVTNWYTIDGSGQAYDESIWLPDYVNLQNATIRGADVGASNANKAILSVGIGWVKDLMIGSGLAVTNNPKVDLLIRDTNVVYTADKDQIGTINAGDTLIADVGQSEYCTAEFDGGETLAEAATTVTTQLESCLGGSVTMSIGNYDHGELSYGSMAPIVKKEGTANAALGFSTTYDTVATVQVGYGSQDWRQMMRHSNLYFPILAWDVDEEPIVSAARIIFDRKTGSSHWHTFYGVTIYSGLNGIIVNDGQVVLYDTYIDSLWGVGATVGAAGFCEFQDSEIVWNYGGDFSVATGGVVKTQATAWSTKSGVGEIRLSAMLGEWVFEQDTLSTMEDGVGHYFVVPETCSIYKITAFRKTAGTAGNTTVDIHYGASGEADTTLYTTQANRPSFSTSEVSLTAKTATLPNTVSLTAGHYLHFIVDSVETDGAGLKVQVYYVTHE